MSEIEPTENRFSENNLQNDLKKYRLLMQNVRGFIGFCLDENLIPIFIDGAVKDMTGYGKEDFQAMKCKWTEIAVPEDQPLVTDYIKSIKSNINSSNNSTHLEYRIQRKDGEIIWVRAFIHCLSENRTLLMCSVCDINEVKQADETIIKNEQARMKEMHHRIKNNLQVICSLLSLQAEKFTDAKVTEAFRESQNRVTSMALIHEELYKGNNVDTIDFANYLQKLIEDLFSSYSLGNEEISLKQNLESLYLNMDTAIPLGIVVNELVSNALKYAFSSQSRGEISITLQKSEEFISNLEPPGADMNCEGEKSFDYVLIAVDNGKGIPKEIDFRNTDSLVLQLVTTLVDQLDGELEIKRKKGTEFKIGFTAAEKGELPLSF